MAVPTPREKTGGKKRLHFLPSFFLRDGREGTGTRTLGCYLWIFFGLIKPLYKLSTVMLKEISNGILRYFGQVYITSNCSLRTGSRLGLVRGSRAWVRASGANPERSGDEGKRNY